MFSYQEKIKAVKLLIQYDMSYATVIRELGYPSKKALWNWYNEYSQNGDLHQNFIKQSKFTDEEKQKAVDYYREHGKCVSRTVKKLGYPSRPMLDKWITELAPDQKRYCRSGGAVVKYTRDQKEQAVISLCSRSKPAKEVAAEYGTTRENLYNWKRLFLKEGCVQSMKKPIKKIIQSQNVQSHETEVSELHEKKDELSSQVAELQKEVHRLKIERDIYEKAAELIKKDKGINLQTLTNREKATIINALRESHQLNMLLNIMVMAKSSYCYQVLAINTDKYADLRTKVKGTFEESSSRYGSRRIHSVIKSAGATISEKVIRRIMKEEDLIVPNIKRKKYSSYKGEITPAVENVINRDFKADKPNNKWLTDITEFHIPAGKIYLSPIIDCFDGLPVSWTIGTSPNAELVNIMLDEAISQLREDEKPIVHSDRGCHYRWPGWLERIEKAELTRSMSKKGCSPDNSACEGFFGRLKNEMFYGCSWTGVTIDQFIDQLDAYIQWYGEKRIKLSLGGMSPLNYRKSLGLVA
ncbi:IS3 family transposase [Acetobacterium carbinolicum]|uniref:IS3 family transposase n=1 Tax=Acetobacterium carbinolicum TaxID=52690 RepID=UPI0039BF033B